MRAAKVFLLQLTDMSGSLLTVGLWSILFSILPCMEAETLWFVVLVTRHPKLWNFWEPLVS